MHIPKGDSLSLCELGIKQKMVFKRILRGKWKEIYSNLYKEKSILGETKLQLYKAMMKIQTKE